MSTSTDEHAVTITSRRNGRLVYITLTCTCGRFHRTVRGPAGLPGTQLSAEAISKAHLTKAATS